MIKYILALLIFTSSVTQAQPPATPRIPVTDNYFGLKVTDNYRWLENQQDTVVKKWMEDQDAYTESIFDRITGRDQLIAEYNMLDSISSDDYYNVRKHDDTYLFLKYLSASGHSVLAIRKRETGKDEVLLDFKKSYPGKKMNIAFFEYSPVSQYIGLYVFENDFEATTLYFYDVAKRQLFPEQIRYAWGGYPEKTKFTNDGKGFFYINSQVENNKTILRDAKAMYHKIGTSADQDKIIMSAKKYPFLGIDSSYMPEVVVDANFKHLILLTAKESSQYIFIAPYTDWVKDTINWICLIKPSDNLGQPIILDGVAYMLSRDVPNRQLKKYKLGNFKNISFETVVPEMKDRLLSVFPTSDYLLLKYSNGINDYYKQYNTKTGKLEMAPMKTQGIMSASRISASSRIDIRNGMRQPQAANSASGMIPLMDSTTPSVSMKPPAAAA